jgi:hypothetical protein
MIHSQESACLLRLYAAGAHVKALARALGRDERTIEAALHREGVVLRKDPPLPSAWRTGLSAASCTALETYLQACSMRLQRAWERLQQAALDVTAADYVFPSREAYEAVLQTVYPPEMPEVLAARLGIDLNRVLLAYAEWAEQAEAPPGRCD